MEAKWKIGGRIDCKDPENKWLAARIKDVEVSPTDHTRTSVLVTYTEFDAKYDEWINSDSNRILPAFLPESNLGDLA